MFQDKDGRYLVDIIRDELGPWAMVVYLIAVALISLTCVVLVILAWL